MNFVHLHLHNEYSYLDGFGKSNECCKYAAEMGAESLAITNHGNVDGAVSFQHACEDNGIKPIQGCELYIVKDIAEKKKGDKRKHVTVLVKSDTGWQNLLKMLTIANLDGFYYRPRVSPEILLKHCEGLVVMTACTSTFITEEWGMNLLSDLKEKIGDDVYLEVMPHDYKEQKEVNLLCVDLSKKTGIKLVATNDCHYIEESDSVIQEVLLAMQIKKKWNDPTRWKFDIDGLYQRTRKEMMIAFRAQGVLHIRDYTEALNNTVEAAEKCNKFLIKEIPVELPEVPEFKGQNENKIIKSICNESFKEKIITIENVDEKKYQERLESELEIIIGQGFVRYFLIIYDLIKYCKSSDIMVGPGRGSSGGSLVSYLLGITEVDPIKYDLLFARFISPARIDLPDIDMDFEDTKRYMIREYLEKTYGADCVAGVSTISRLKGKGAIRDVSRVFDVPLVDVNKACECIVTRIGGDFRADYTIEDAFNTFEDGIKFRKKYPKIVEYAMKLEGQAKTKGQHAAAVIISKDNLRDGLRANLIRGKDDCTIVNWEKYDCEHFGLMKLDILGLSALSVLNDAKKAVKKNYGVDIDYNKIDLTEEKAFEEFSKGNCTGCFQLGSLGLRKFCKRIGVDDFEMLVHTTSLYRPGTLRSGMTNEFVKRKRKEVEWEHKHPSLEKITSPTLGIILYQEQVMQFMYDLGGLGWKTADTVRKVISKSQGVEQFKKFRQLFVDGCIKRQTLDGETAGELWDELSSFGSYGFNKSHAVEYSLITYWDMWLKVHYPQEFICALLSKGSDDKAKKREYVEEAIRIGLDARPPKIGISKAFDWIIKDNILYCPFIDILGFGEKTAEKAADDSTKLTARYLNILLEIDSDKNVTVTEEQHERISKYFKFNFIQINKFENFMNLFIESVENFDKVENIDFNKINKDQRTFIGEMTEIKFGYKSKVSELNKKSDSRGTSNLGGVCGNFKDETDFCILIFDSKIYLEKKDAVEHCAEDLIIVRASNPNRAGSLLCNNAWFEDEIVAGELSGLGMKLKKQSRFKNTEISSCKRCGLREECTEPIVNATGKYNIMIVGEAPGRDEDRQGKPLVGAVGNVVWKALDKYGYTRRDFNITNVVKCHPSKTKSPHKKHIEKCKKWLMEEINEIKPFLILAFGNTSIKAFTEDEKGIMSKSGTTEWFDDLGAWICWCIHPASVLYSPENYELFNKGIKNFVEKIKIFE